MVAKTGWHGKSSGECFLIGFRDTLDTGQNNLSVKPRSRKQILRQNKGKGKKVNEVFDKGYTRVLNFKAHTFSNDGMTTQAD